MLSTKCQDDHKGSKDAWFYPRGKDINKTCKRIESLHGEEVERLRLTASDVVFAVQFPLPRDDQELTMSRWFQGMLGVLHPEIVYQGEAGLDGNGEFFLTANRLID